MKTYEIAPIAALAAISAVLQIVHIGWLSPWGMWIDLVGVPWIIAYFLYGGRAGLITSVIGAIIITIVAPSTWLGALLKFTATLPMWFIPMIYQKIRKIDMDKFSKSVFLPAAILIAIIVRMALVLPINYYFAIPIWTGWNTAQAMEFVPWWIMCVLNIVQGALEVAIAWFVVFRFGISRFSK